MPSIHQTPQSHHTYASHTAKLTYKEALLQTIALPVTSHWQKLSSKPPSEVKLSERKVSLNTLPGLTAIKAEQATVSIFNKIKKYTGFSAKIYSLFGAAVKIEGIGYVNKKELSQRVIYHLTGDKKISEEYKSNSIISQKIQHFVKKQGGIEGFQKAMTQIDTKTLHKFKNVTRMDLYLTLDHLDPNNIKQIEWSDHISDDIRKNLKPGDIMFFQHGETIPSFSSTLIIHGHRLAKLWLKGELEPYSETYTHTTIYVGDGKFAEAVPGDHKEDVRIFTMDAIEGLKLRQGDHRSYRICRPQNQELAKFAAEVSNKYAEDKLGIKKQVQKGMISASKLKTKLSYDKFKAARSLLGNAEYGKKAKRNAYKQVVELSNNAYVPKNRKGETRGFFCSQFVMECIQRGNVLQLMPEIARHTKIPIPRLTGNAKRDQEITKKWVDKMLKEQPDLLDKLLIKYDPNFVSPQKFRSIVGSNPQLFKDVISIIPPKEKT
ncbi:MAG: hypothetical protein H0W88_02810 [Parachlamydiaceae bacterium]|nr:hypothetical protein [Parachlamydiaceae bacterium]